MGSGSWDTSSFASYTCSTRGVSNMDVFTTASASDFNVQSIYKSTRLASVLNPYKVMRECRDSEEHPNTLPVILALDVTGSMGTASVRVAQKLNDIMTEIYSSGDVPDVEFCIMGIGDLAYDSAPIQISQFESDIRIAEQLDAIYFEGGGGGNKYESYTAAWYMGINHCDLDCWKRNKKGIIITLGDERPNPHLPRNPLHSATGDTLQGDVETKELINDAREKFNLYHIAINDSATSYGYHNMNGLEDKEWKELLGEDNYFVAGLDNLAEVITKIIVSNIDNSINNTSEVNW